jgi:hypothetical protein
MLQPIQPPHSLADAHTLIAQHYAGALVGHPYRAGQQDQRLIEVSTDPWREPNVVADSCVFCRALNDAEATRRVAGYQHQLDTEATRNKGRYYTAWVQSGSRHVPDPESSNWPHSAVNLRAFCELFQNEPRPEREGAWAKGPQPQGWRTRPFPLVNLPMRLKRKLCIEWNHLYIAWMEDAWIDNMDIITYDFATQQFMIDVQDVEIPFSGEQGC